MNQPQTHETLSRHEPAGPGSERSFGFVMAGAFAAVFVLGIVVGIVRTHDLRGLRAGAQGPALSG